MSETESQVRAKKALHLPRVFNDLVAEGLTPMTGPEDAPERERTRLSAARCDGCGATFQPVRAWHRHCSGRCRAKANRERRVRDLAATIARLTVLAGVKA